MNERIKLLGRQAGLVFIEDGVYGQRWYSSKCGLDVSEYEKLVELIVKKCMAVAKYHTPDTEECEHTWLIHDKIKEHFGVEE